MKPFIEYLRAQLGNIYAWGGQGDNLSGLHDPIKWIKGQEDDAENRQRVINFYKKRKAEGQYPIKAFDCSGLIMYFLDDLHGVMDDKSAQMLYQKCKKIKKDELQEGDPPRITSPTSASTSAAAKSSKARGGTTAL